MTIELCRTLAGEEASFPANFAKLAAVTFFAFWFLSLFQELLLLVVVALIIPWVDAYSVFRGPTGEIVEKHPHVFTHLSFGFPLPGHQTARPPDRQAAKVLVFKERTGHETLIPEPRPGS